MLEVKNLTPFQAALVPGLDAAGRETATVAVKGTFVLLPASSAEPLPLHEPQEAVALADVPYGEPAEKHSLRYAAESGPAKAGTDVALIGHAYAPHGDERVVDVQLRVGALHKSVRVFGDRTWARVAGRLRPSLPRPFEKLPLVYERAFGGWDTTAEDATKHGFEARNPVGVGFAASRGGDAEGTPLPNLEDPHHLIQAVSDQPAPTGFGFLAPSWSPRRERAGTYDARWQHERSPLLPSDFDPRFFQSAPDDLLVAGHLKGGEPVTITNATPAGRLAFVVPRRALEIKVWIRGAPVVHQPVLDTLTIEPDAQRVLCTWKTTFACPRRFLYIDLIRIRELSP